MTLASLPQVDAGEPTPWFDARAREERHNDEVGRHLIDYVERIAALVRILFVAMQSSIHVARWTAHLRGLGWDLDLHLFPADSALPHPELHDVLRPRFFMRVLRDESVQALFDPLEFARQLAGSSQSRRIYPVPCIRIAAAPGATARPAPASPAVATGRHKGAGPRIHSIEFQHAGYLTLWAKERTRVFAP
jgi:hypothetical protein